MTPTAKLKMGLDEYLEFDKNSEERWEYFDGEVFCMSGVSRAHAIIESNTALELIAKSRQEGCQVFPASMKIKVPVLPTYRYPDLSVSCGTAEFIQVGGVDCLTNPRLIVEVLSASTESYDRGAKFTEYKSIPSFSEYLLISSTVISVVLHQKHHDRFWLQSEYTTGESFHLNTLDLDVAVDDLYRGVDLTPHTT